MMGYALLSEDLTDLNEGFDACRARSVQQILAYPKPAKGKSISHDQYGREPSGDKPALRLFMEDGYDGAPVGSLSAKSARAFWYLGGDHQFPPMVDLVRLGFFFHLDLTRTAFLALKGEWERHLGDERDYRTGVGMNLVDVFHGSPGEGELRRFRPPVEDLYACITNLAQGVRNGDSETPLERAMELDKLEAGGYFRHDLTRFRTLIDEMLLHRLFLHALGDPVVEEFAKAKNAEFSLLERGTEREQQAFWSAKATWLELQESLGDLLLAQEQARLRNAHVQADFLRIFGEEYLALQKAILELRTWERRLMTRQAHPDWPESRIEEALRDSEQRAREELDRLCQDASMARVVDEIAGTGTLDGEELAALFQRMKAVLREIFLLFHEDRLAHDPVYVALTDPQKSQLDDLLKRALDIKADQELRYAKGTLGYANRSLTELVNILERGKAILKHAGINVRVELLIQGTTLGEKLAWLSREIDQLRLDAGRIRSQVIAFNQDRETRERKLIVDCVSEHGRIRQEFLAKSRDYREKAEVLVHQYEALGVAP